MLEPRNIEDQFQELKKHLSTLLDARRNIEKAEEQLKMLQPVKDQYEQFQQLKQQKEELETLLNTAGIWKKYTQHELLRVASEQIRQQEKELVQKNRAA